MEMLYIADLLPNGLHEKVVIGSICYITKSRLDIQFVKEIPLKTFSGWKKMSMIKINDVFILNVPFICYLSRIIINVLSSSGIK